MTSASRSHRNRDQTSHAVLARILVRVWLPVVWACRRDGACYAPETHHANRKINTTAETTAA
ncbi:hypothetical protein AB0I22_10220 [Streptomyces sp. NPDC050610]|uniref:hypothetical protein n=1 Tax=Streptomyces sp. NPDC050610 TaxID=3157097 RepID=UPI003436C5A7